MKNVVLTLILFCIVLSDQLYSQLSIDLKTKQLNDKVKNSEGVEKSEAYLEFLSFLVMIDPNRVDKIAAQALGETMLQNDDKTKVRILILKGFALAKMHKPLEASGFYHEAYNLALEIKDTSAVCSSLIRIGTVNILFGDINEAIANFIEAEHLAEKISDKVNLADAINYLGISHYLIDDLEQALVFSEKALNLSIEIDHKAGIALALEHITIVNIKLEKYDEALKFNSEALKYREELHDLPSISGLYYNYSVIYGRLNNIESAIDYTKKSIQLRKEIGNSIGVGSNYLSLGNIFLRANQPDSALGYLQKAYDIKSGTGDTRTITSIIKSLSEVYERKNDYKNAYKYLSLYKTYSDSLFREDSRRITSKVIAQQEIARKEEQIEHLQAVNSFQEKTQNFLIVIIVLGTLLFTAMIVLYLINRKANRQLSEKNGELITLNKDRNKFFSIITHDLRSPFHPIIGYSDLVINDINSLSRSEIKDYVSNINVSAKKVYDLLDNLLQWLGLHTGRMEFKPVKVDLKEELDKAIDLFQNNIDDKSISIDLSIEESKTVYADRSMLGIILRNLISNAIKFSDVNNNIEIKTSNKNGYVALAVTDNGIGISKERLNSIFNDEMKSTKGTKNESGTGLGLVLSKEMTERHGGEFFIDSEEDKGTTVSFTLPVYKN